MPREHRKRGRRDEQKKKRRRDADDEPAPKRHKTDQPDHLGDDEPAHAHLDPTHDQDFAAPASHADAPAPAPAPFYGLLDDDEHEYFRRADEQLELNHFDDAEARRLFIENVWKEADGKELKVASSQSCSRLLERLILLSTPDQLKALFRTFNGHFLNLVQHRFASHCCEALFLHAAPTVTLELAQPETSQAPPSDPDQIFVSMEQLFLYTLSELQPHISFLMTDKFASHALRVLLLVLSGSPLEKQNKSVLQSKRKEKVSISGLDKTPECVVEKRAVPQSFLEALEKVIDDSVSGFEPHYLRSLAIHPLGNPTLQLLLKLELAHFGKSRAKDERSIIHQLLPDDPMAEGTESASFINGLVYDAIGSRLLETIIENAPGKLFKSIYAEFFASRMGSLARNEIAGYVAGKILERLGKDDLEEAMRQIVDQIPNLTERSRTAIIKTLIERCLVRGVDTSAIRAQLEIAYGGSKGFEVTRILKLSEEEDSPNGKHDHSHEKVHGSLLAQAMMSVPGRLGNLVFDSLANLSSELSVQLAHDPAASRTLQAALTSPNASVIFRRKMIQQFYGRVGELALDPAASRVVDAIWEGTHGLAFIRERIAEELAENENSLRESLVGRAVWRNWRMDLYKRRRADWVKQSRYTAGNDGFLSFPEDNGEATASLAQSLRASKHMTAIELARQKHAAAKAAEAKREKRKGDSVSSSASSKHKATKKRRSDRHATTASSVTTESTTSKGKEKQEVAAQ